MNPPDFAFPLKVKETASADLAKALKANKPVEALRAFMDLDIASAMISKDSALHLLGELDSISSGFDTPYSGIGYLLEAEIYRQIYDSERPTLDNRTVAQTMEGNSPLFWDYSLFAAKIDTLVKRALAQRGPASEMPLQKIAPLVSHSMPTETFSVYDFFVYKSIQLTKAIKRDNIIPFYGSPEPAIEDIRLIDNLLILHSKASLARSTALLNKASLLPKDEGKKWLWEILKQEGDLEQATFLALHFFNEYIHLDPTEEKDTAPTYRDFYNFANSIAKKSPAGKDTKELDALLSKMREGRISVRFPEVCSPSRSIRADVSCSNFRTIYLLLLDLKGSDSNRFSIRQLETGAKVLETQKITFPEDLPFSRDSAVDFTVSNPGIYTIVASKSPQIKDIISNSNEIYVSRFRATDIDLLSLDTTLPADSKEENIRGCFVVRSSDGSPIEGAEVTFEKTIGPYASRQTKKETRATDKSGFAASELEDPLATAIYEGSVNSLRIYTYTPYREGKNKALRFFTDRATYRPGDIVRFMAIAFEADGNEGHLLKGQKFDLTLRDFNNQIVDSLELATDNSGRLFGSFTLPQDGLLGMWYINSNYGSATFNVAEYKVPSFFITMEKTEAEADSISFKGKVSTYSGMPLGGLEVDFNINYSPFRFYYGYSHESQSYSSTVITDADGNFTITLPLGNLDPQKYRGLFTIAVSAGDEAGERIDSAQIPFWLSATYTISPSIAPQIEIKDATLPLHVPVTDMAGLPVVRQVEYSLINGQGGKISSGTFESPGLNLPVSNLPSGEYTLEFRLAEGEAQPCKAKCIFYRSDDAVPPIETTLWVPRREIVTDCANVSIPFGCSYPGQYILCVVSDSKGKTRYEWIVSDGKMTALEIDSPGNDIRGYVTLATYRNHTLQYETVTLIPRKQKEELEIKTETFRKTISAGAQETWNFSILYGGKPVKAYAYALLYDSAMEAIDPLNWSAGFFMPTYRNSVRLSGNSTSLTQSTYFGPSSKMPSAGTQTLNFQTYGQWLYPSWIHENRYLMKSASRASNDMVAYAVTDCSVEMCEEAPAAAITAGAAEEGAESSEDGNTEMRPIEMPVAFFMPDLSSSKDGEVKVSFKVPDFNTTWKFKLGAYDSSLSSDMLTLETVASKEVMVKMLAPRFLRTGDKAVITATIFNNSPSTELITGQFEIFNPYSGEILKQATATTAIDPSRNRIISIEYDCPANLDALGLRVFGKTGTSSDGEETIIPVLPSSQPIVESQPFYIPAGEKNFSFPIEEGKNDATVTFKYCDNPLWEVVTALPPIITPESETLTSLVTAFYANSVGAGLVRSNPLLREGLQLIFSSDDESVDGESLLTGNLEKDAALKTVTLNDTPWVNDAQSETMRLSKLSSLLDTANAESTIRSIWERIEALRNPDGGWSWCKGMKSSSWMTHAVLINIALLRGEGYLPNLPGLGKTTEQAVQFLDGEWVEDYYKTKGEKGGFYISMLPYLYVRSFFPEISSSFSMRKISKEALDYLDTHWKELSIFNKATAAITLQRGGHTRQAKLILESLRQFASHSREKGVWFDNLDSDWRGAGKLLTTARVLFAFHEVEPGDPVIDGMRQWLLIQKQAQDWQEGLWAIDAIDALLTTGSQWIGNHGSPVISICGKTVPEDKISKLTGSVTMNIVLTSESKSSNAEDVIKILRFSESPAWGGIISQYIAPMVEVKAQAISDLSINKEIWKIVENENGKQAIATDNLNVGDRVRITLIVDCGRDMDFVALTDERAACLEPSQQLSGYDITDGLWCYKETRNSSTNLFFDFLPKGRHIINYECKVMEEGEFAGGVATLQCQYSPLLTAHSAGVTLKVTGR